MISIDHRYIETEEAGRSKAPYDAFYECLCSAFDMSSIGSLIDVGCADGHLIDIVYTSHPHIEVAGIEYFDYHLKHAGSAILEKIQICDIRLPLPTKKYDIVVCTEVGEHIDPDCCAAFMRNLKSLTSKYLVMTWSSHGGENDLGNDPHHQHLNPLSLHDYESLIQSYGYALDDQKTQLFMSCADNQREFFSWWKESLRVWKL